MTSARPRWASFGSGAFLLAAFAGLGCTDPGLFIGFFAPFTASTPGELQFWLGSVLLLLPGSALVGAGLPALGQPLAWAWRRAASLSAAEARVACAVAFAWATAVATIGHQLILRGYPLTDDEWATRFGGEALALGHVAVPAPPFLSAVPSLFLWVHGGRIGSIDWPGVQLVQALSRLTHLEALPFALFAALPVPCLAAAVARRLGWAWGVAAAVLFLFSPMAFALSLTTHAHVVSRAALAVAIAAALIAVERSSVRRWAVVALALGVGFLARPLETTFFALPAAAALTWRVVKGRIAARPVLLGALAGLAAPAAVFAAFNQASTGALWLPARFAAFEPGQMVFGASHGSLWERFGTNVGQNALLLLVWFAGPLGALGVALGARASRATQVLLLGVASQLALGLFHDDQGVHLVGPIHYSECAVPLAFVAVHGMKRMTEALRAHVGARSLASALACTVVLGLGAFDAWHAAALRDSARIQELSYDFLDGEAGIHNAVVLAPRFLDFWSAIPRFRARGAWVFSWRRPQPDFSDDVLILHDAPGSYEALRPQLPNRAFYRLRAATEGVPFSLEPLGPAPPARSSTW